MCTRSQLLSVVTVLLIAGSVLHAQTFEGFLDVSVPTGAATSLTTEDGGSTLSSGIGSLGTDGTEVLPAGFALIRYRPNGVLISETSVPMTRITHFGRIYVEVGGAVNTGVAIANPTANPVTINFSFMDTSGAIVKTGTTQLLPFARVTRFVNEAPFSLKGDFIGTLTITASGPPVSIIAIRGFTNERSEFLISNVPVIQTDFGGEDSFLPHFANGYGWTTQVVLVNSSDQPVSGTFQFLNNENVTGDDQPIEIVVNGQSDSSFAYLIPPGSAQTFLTNGEPEDEQVGSIRLIQSPGSSLPLGYVILSFRQDGVTVTQDSFVGAPRPTVHRMYVEEDLSQGIQTGIGILNPGTDNISIIFNVTDLNGQPTGLSGTIPMDAFGHSSKFLREIPGLETLPQSFKGVVQIVTAYRIGASLVGLRTRLNERGELLISSNSPVPEQFDPTDPSILVANPHIVNGAGYTTELVFFSPASVGAPAPTGGVFNFFAETANAIEFTPPLQ